MKYLYMYLNTNFLIYKHVGIKNLFTKIWDFILFLFYVVLCSYVQGNRRTDESLKPLGSFYIISHSPRSTAVKVVLCF